MQNPENPFEALLDHQQQFFSSGKTREYAFRREALKKLRTVIRNHEEELYQALYQDLHKSKFESYSTEIGFVLEELRLVLRNLKEWMRPEKVSSGLINFPASSYVTQEPMGTVLIIAPWNYPFQLLIAPLIGALAAGNTVILKPSEISEHTAQVMEKMINTHFEKKLVHVVNGGVEVSQQLLQLKVNHIFFTGSSYVGKIVMQAAAKNMVPVTLELGGKSPCIVDEKVNLKQAARRIMWGKLINAGQTCIAPDYLMVHEKVKQDLVKEMIRVTEQFYGKDPQQSSEYPRIVSDANVERLATLLEGAKIAYGGQIDRSERYFSPTILDAVQFDLPVMQQEIFGPILPVITYSDINQAIQQINTLPHPLALYVFSNRRSIVKKVVENIPAGGVTVNDTIMHIANSKLPFGGVGNSGTGKYHGAYSFSVFSNAKPVMFRKRWLDVPLRYAPFKNKIRLVKNILR
ncbi:MAG: aldehyde dehydrogenase [Bacteroidales bacterium]|nr:aldehyde dehydrogenase [Bacteroidales bacterium]